MLVELEREGKIAVITINRPRALNSLDVATFQEFHDRMVEFRDDPELWVGIITGAGSRAFSIGADIKEMLPHLKEHRGEPGSLPDSLMRGLAIYKPLIAAINGMALGGGLEVALACDIRIASEKARFGVPEVTLGLIPGWGGTQRLVRMLSWCKAAELLFTGEFLDAEEACRLGLINRVVPQEQVMPVAKEWAEKICQAAPLAVRAAKEAMVRGGEMSLEDGLKLENSLEAFVCGTEDFTEGLNARAERRRPIYRAK
ncbi:MAG: enoyl-CoA hydratase-related protein [Chloroflexota bacterium]